MNKEAMERFNLAVGQDPNIVASKQELELHAGNEPEYLAQLGLEKKHLRRLERAGIAIKARTKNIWLPGETMPDGKVVEVGSTYRGRGSRTMWLLVKQ